MKMVFIYINHILYTTVIICLMGWSMETDITKCMKEATHWCLPKLSTRMRTIRYADEVVTPNGGKVDSIRFEDYVCKDSSFCKLIDYGKMSESNLVYIKNENMGHCKKDGLAFPNEKCHGCIWKASSKEIGMMITCFEVKISLSDFKSKNGHNFFGNENYYCVPKELVKDILPLVPDDVGILSWHETAKSRGYHKVKDAKWHEVPEEDKTFLLYNALKKWCDRRM